MYNIVIFSLMSFLILHGVIGDSTGINVQDQCSMQRKMHENEKRLNLIEENTKLILQATTKFEIELVQEESECNRQALLVEVFSLKNCSTACGSLQMFSFARNCSKHCCLCYNTLSCESRASFTYNLYRKRPVSAYSEAIELLHKEVKSIQAAQNQYQIQLKKILAAVEDIKSKTDDYPSCDVALKENNGKAGRYKINWSPIYCFFDKEGYPSFQIGHNHEKNVLVDGPERPPKHFPLVYEIGVPMVVSLVRRSSGCSQEIFYDKCQGVWLLNEEFNYLRDRNGKNLFGKKDCNCQHFQQCQDGPFPVSLKASINNKDVLPLTAVGVGDTGYDQGCVENCAGKLDEHTYFRIGKLVCRE